MSKKNDGGFAFPSNTTTHEYPGMSLRDWFAGMAMNGIISAAGDSEGTVDYQPRYLADSAYKMADAMLEQRKV